VLSLATQSTVPGVVSLSLGSLDAYSCDTLCKCNFSTCVLCSSHFFPRRKFPIRNRSLRVQLVLAKSETNLHDGLSGVWNLVSMLARLLTPIRRNKTLLARS
jgi:hypothetical protein